MAEVQVIPPKAARPDTLRVAAYVSHTRPLRRLFAWPMPLTGRWNSQETVRRLSPTSCKGQLPGMPAVMMVWIRL